MNARVDPAALYVPVPGDNDVSLIALCRRALKALEQDLALDEAFNKLTDRFDAMRPAYPRSAGSPFWGEGASSKELKVVARDNPPVSQQARREFRTHIADVAAWERACAELRKSSGLDAVDRQYQRAMDVSEKLVELLAGIEAQTLVGASYKSMVVARWLTAGYAITDHGEQLVLSILSDVRRLGEAKAGDGGKRRRAT